MIISDLKEKFPKIGWKQWCNADKSLSSLYKTWSWPKNLRASLKCSKVEILEGPSTCKSWKMEWDQDFSAAVGIPLFYDLGTSLTSLGLSFLSCKME